MNDPHSQGRVLLRILLLWTSLTTLVFWLPTVRGAFDGASYEWGAFGFGGSGTSGDYWFPVLGSALALATLWLGWRGARFPFKILLVGWNSFLAIALTVVVRSDPEGFHIKGDTAGMDLDLAVIGPAFFGIWAVLAWWWALRHRRTAHAPTAPWTKRNAYWVMALAALFPVQFLLLHSGSMESAQDLAGVLITVLQWMLVGIAFAPARARASYPDGKAPGAPEGPLHS